MKIWISKILYIFLETAESLKKIEGPTDGTGLYLIWPKSKGQIAPTSLSSRFNFKSIFFFNQREALYPFSPYVPTVLLKSIGLYKGDEMDQAGMWESRGQGGRGVVPPPPKFDKSGNPTYRGG